MVKEGGFKPKDLLRAADRIRALGDAQPQTTPDTPQTKTPEKNHHLQVREDRAALKDALKKAGAKFASHESVSATLDGAMRNTAESARLGKEIVEACARLKEKIDTQVVTLMNMMNKSLDIGTDGRAYSNDLQQDKIIPNPTASDLISSFRNTELVTRELAELVKDMPHEIEILFQTLDDSHAEFVSIIAGEKIAAPKRTFLPPPSVDSIPRAPQPGRAPSSVEASLQAALSESANRAEFLQVLVEASKRLKERIDERVVTVLTMMNQALSRGVDNVAYGYDEANNRMVALQQPDLIVGFTTTEEVARGLEEAVADLPKNIQLLLEELMAADEEFNELISKRLNKQI